MKQDTLLNGVLVIVAASAIATTALVVSNHLSAKRERPSDVTAVRAVKEWRDYVDSLGGGWLNTASVDYMVRGAHGRMVLPQIIVVEREIEVSGNVLSVGRDSLVARILANKILAMGEKTSQRPASR